MKIVFLTRLFLPHIGGVEKHVMEVSKILLQKGHEVAVITEMLYDIPYQRISEEINGIQVYRIDVGKDDKLKKFRIWREMGKLHSVISRADVVHCHDVFFWYLPFRLLYPAKPVYTTFHGYESYPVKKSAKAIRKLSEEFSFGNLCIGDFIAKWYGTKPTLVSYGAADIIVSAANIKKKESAVFMGRLDEQTGVLVYAKAIEFLKKKYPKFIFDIIGDGKDRGLLENKFNVLGFLDKPERYFPRYHFAFVSRYLSILEAFAARRLVFAVYDNPIKEDYLKLAPFVQFIIIEKEPSVLAEKIAYFLKHPKEEQKLVEQGYQWVQDQTWENVVALYLKLWDKHVT
ncbi:MAG TPA: glycosyltransferase family 4 protein [Candidatus Sulfotelmatobacter sp.]|jgi:glycosyltransferase involved in cell wall biosynthesis|nr:glycosyltransferase family 4 protein [Candidatus Sulfotelmatobacter sp.]